MRVGVSKHCLLLWVEIHITHENKRLLFSTSLINIGRESAKMTRLSADFLIVAVVKSCACGSLLSFISGTRPC